MPIVLLVTRALLATDRSQVNDTLPAATSFRILHPSLETMGFASRHTRDPGDAGHVSSNDACVSGATESGPSLSETKESPNVDPTRRTTFPSNRPSRSR